MADRLAPHTHACRFRVASPPQGNNPEVVANQRFGVSSKCWWLRSQDAVVRGERPQLCETFGRSRGTEGMTFRVMGPHEWGRFAPEAWGHLLRLSDSGALNGPELEQVIERALAQFDGRIALDDLRSLIDQSGLDESGSGLDQVNVH